MTPFEDLLAEVKKRNDVKLEQAESLLDLALVPGESKTRISFLNLAERQLSQVHIFKKWLDLSIQEQDPLVQAHLLRGLASFGHSGNFQESHGELLLNSLDALLPYIEQESLRVEILNILSALLSYKGQTVGEKLSQVYSASDSASYKWVIFGLIYWIRHTWQQAPAFLLAHFKDTPLEYRAGILSFLLQKKAVPVSEQVNLLSFVPEYDHVRFILTQYHLEACTELHPELEKAFIKVMQQDSVPECRIYAACVLIRHQKGLSEALEQLKSSDQPEFRRVLFQELSTIDQGSEAFLEALLSFLKTEKDPALFADILHHLFPKIADDSAFGESLRQGLLELTWTNITVELAQIVFNVLGSALKSHASLRHKFAEAYQHQNRDELRACILYWLADYCKSEVSVQELVVKGIQSPSQPVRDAALSAVLSLPLIQPFFELILSASSLLTDRDIETAKRRRLAARIAAVGHYPEDQKAILQAALPFIEDAALREKLEASISRSRSSAASNTASQAADQPDWDAWLRKVTSEKSVRGIFPAIYISFEQNPEKSRNILDAVLARQDELSLGHFADPIAILEFLNTKGMADENMLRWVWEFLLSPKTRTDNDLRRCLAILKSAPAAKAKRHELWKFMEKENVVRNCGTVILLDSFFILYEGEQPFVAEFKQQLAQVESPGLLSNYIMLLEKSTGYPWAKDCLLILARRIQALPGLTEASSPEIRKLWELLEQMGISPESAAAGSSDTGNSETGSSEAGSPGAADQINTVPPQPGLLDD